jgi:hypothetical protein
MSCFFATSFGVCAQKVELLRAGRAVKGSFDVFCANSRMFALSGNDV